MPRTAAPARRRRGPGRPPGAVRGDRKAALLEAARGVMAERGLPRLTLREVAERAGVKPALVAYYFGGKEGLLREVMRDVSERMLARVEAAIARQAGVEERLRSVVRAAVGMHGEDRFAPRLMVEQVLFGEDEVIDEFVERYASRNLELIGGLLDAGVREGRLRPLDHRFLLPLVLGGTLFFFLAAPVLQRLFGITDLDPEIAERFADHTVDVLLHGILRSQESLA